MTYAWGVPRRSPTEALLTLALGLAPFFAGCFAGHIDATNVAREGVAFSGAPLPVRAIVFPATIRLDPDTPPVVAEIAARSLVSVLRGTRLFADVRLAGVDDDPAAPPPDAALAALPAVRLEPEILDFALYQSYAWWGLYAAFFAIPVVGTGAIVVVIFLAGGPVVSDHGAVAIRVRARDERSGALLGTYEGRGDAFEPHNIWNAGEHLESFYYHPETLFQSACGGIASRLIEDRWTYQRLAAGKLPGH
jgi:hypothetical protein